MTAYFDTSERSVWPKTVHFCNTVHFGLEWSIFEPLDCKLLFSLRIYKMTAECEKTSQQIILRDIELNLQTKFIEKLKHMIGTDFNA